MSGFINPELKHYYMEMSNLSKSETGLPTVLWVEEFGKERSVGHNKDIIREVQVGINSNGDPLTMQVKGNPRVKIWPKKGESPNSRNGFSSIIINVNGEAVFDDEDLRRKNSTLTNKDLETIDEFITINLIPILKLWNGDISLGKFKKNLVKV